MGITRRTSSAVSTVERMGGSRLRSGSGQEHTPCSLATQPLAQPVCHAIIRPLSRAWDHGSRRILGDGIMALRHTRLPAPGDLGYDMRWAWVLEQGMEGGTR